MIGGEALISVSGKFMSIVNPVSIPTAAYKDNAIEALLEPGHRVLLLDTMRESNSSLLLLPPCHPCTWSAHHDVEVHSKDTDTRIVSRSQINVLLDSEPEVASLREVPALQLVFLHLQAPLENLLSFRATDGNMDSDLLVTTDAERADGVAGF